MLPAVSRDFSTVLYPTTTVRNPITVKFESRYDETIAWGRDNISSYIDIEDPTESIAKQRYPDEVVIPMLHIRIKYDYPLEWPVILKYRTSNPRGFTRASLARVVCRGYKKIFCKDSVTSFDNISWWVGEPINGECNYCIGDLGLRTVTQEEGDLFVLEVDS